MANEVENAIRSAAEQIVKYVEDVGTLQVQTGYVAVGTNVSGDITFDTARPIASTIIRFDGDCKAVITMRDAGNGVLEVDNALLELHQRNVDAAIEYRARIVNALITAIQSRTK